MNPMCGAFRTSWRQWLPAAAASSAMIAVGTDMYWLLHAIDNMESGSEYKAWYSVVLFLGILTNIAIGSIAGALATDKFGRRKALLLGSTIGILPTMGFFAPATAWPWITLYVGAIGNVITRIALPVYVSEIAGDDIRGALMLFQMLFVHIGRIIGDTAAMHVPPYILSVVSVIIYGLYLFAFLRYPDTPYYFAMHKRYDRAKESLAVYTGVMPSVKNEAIQDLTNVVEANGNAQDWCSKIRKLFSGRYLRGMFIILVLLTVRLNETVFDSETAVIILTWLSSVDERFAMITLDVITLVFIAILVFVIDVAGRKPVTLFAIGGGFVAVIFYISLPTHTGLLITMNVFLHICQITLFSIPIIFVGEFFPTNLKATAATFVVFTEEITRWSIHLIRMALQAGWTYYVFFAGLCISIVLVIVFIPETKRKNYFEIQNELDRTLVIERLDVTRFCRNRSESQILES